MKQLEKDNPGGLGVHALLDNDAAHKPPGVWLWIAQQPRWHLHLIPTHSSWLNQVERCFARITQERIRRESFRSVAQHRQAPKPVRWTASADLVLGKVQNSCSSLP